MRIEFLIATMNRTDAKFLDSIFQNIESKEKINGVVINQCSIDKLPQIESKYRNIKIISVKDKGLSKSRNLALKHATGDICVIADDDVVYKENVVETIKNSYEATDADVIKFQIETPEGEPYKKYSLKIRRENLRSSMGTSSIEITFNRKSIVSKNLAFDERFGLGSTFKGSEDVIFLSDCIKHELRCFCVPKVMVIHPKESSGTDYRAENTNLVVNIGAMLMRVFGAFKSSVIIPLYSLKRYKFYKNAYSFQQFLLLMFKGRKMFMRSRKVD